MAVKKVNLKNWDFEISYEILNPKSRRDLVVLHGWGSSKDIMKSAFSNSLSNYRQIYIDLPGFGKSSNRYILNSRDYADIVLEFLNKIDAKRDTIIGHSFGGKVATLLEPDTLVLLSSAGIVEPKPILVKLKISLFKLLKRSTKERFRSTFASKDVSGMSKNMYETFKNVVDEDFSQIFSQYRGEALIFWGREDSATTLCSGELISTLINGSEFYPLDGDHYFFLDSKNIDFIDRRLNG